MNCNLLTELEVDGPSYRRYMRMDRCHFQDLVERVAPFISRCNTKFHDAISVEERLAVTLRFLATGRSTKKFVYAMQIAITFKYLIKKQPIHVFPVSA
jgi:acyl-CoA thioesterase FadM